ncbi:FecR domain-containing protein [Duganella sp. PWIR1]
MTESLKPGYAVLEQAAEWFAVLGETAVSASQTEAWRQWLAASPEHQCAWQQVEQVNQQLQALPGTAARLALTTVPKRRRTLKTLLLLGATTGLGAVLARREETREYLAALGAGQRTAVGQVATLALPDSTQAWLNTDSAADLAYDDRQRLILLQRGEVLLHSGADAHLPARPLLVEARGVRLRALGTRFSVRLMEQGTRLAVYDGAVEAGGVVVPAGAQVDIVDGRPGAMTSVHEDGSAWSRRLLIATQMRLDDFLAELARYRHGHLACDPALAGLRLVGSYPLGDTDQALDMLQAALPVRVKRTLPWWVSVTPR